MERVLFWARYIDDVLMIWQGTTDELESFMRQLNHNTKNIKVTYSYDYTSIPFLDVTLIKDSNGFLQTDIYRKPTATNTYLHATSAHPKHVVKAIPVGQYLRIRRICSSDERFEEQAKLLQKRFKERGYSQRCLKYAYKRAKATSRHQLLHRKKEPIPDDTVRYISDYNDQWDTMRRVIEKHLPILRTDPILQHYIPPRIQMTARRARNLKDILVKMVLHHRVTNSPPFFWNPGILYADY
ncbi:uncharacterized protein LOC130298192 [Hyla sarda]|uniref:uncharacterized protein LOC130297906 n=1 Tax=Hyla sarda TaxID=327740 RepID=UPI0024C2FF8E|nr:uncharacterized protein LOC130297906 [Hyla sarda]XP_056407084.1 uncharacterized protein LOC130298192 [Hyla sarda]